MKYQLYNKNYPEEVGFFNNIGAHTSRTIMFKELTLLFNATDEYTDLEEIRKRVYQDNILHKKSISGRMKTFGFLKKIYGLNQNSQIYNALRWAWSVSNENERPLLAILCAISRDVSLRITAPYILPLPRGGFATKEKVMELIEESFPHRYNPTVLDSMALNLLSSWKQSGHLQGITKKIRKKANSGPSSCTFALAIGYLAGYRGRLLLDTIWVRALDATEYEIQEYLQRAMKKGWIRYQESGGMMEISFQDEVFGKVGNI